MKQYFVFSKKERLGMAVLLVLIFSMWLLPEFFGRDTKVPEDILRKASLEREKMAVSQEAGNASGSIKFFRLFPFDPNTIDEAGWKELGIRPKTISIIQKYVARGGQFRNPDDLLKIYSLRPDEAKRLIPYVRIKNGSPGTVMKDESSRSLNQFHKQAVFPLRKIDQATDWRIHGEKKSFVNPFDDQHGPVYKRKNFSHQEISPVDINTADTSLFIALPGIGSRLAARIILFREKLGGFYSIEQLTEIYGLQDSVFQLIKSRLQISHTGLRKININTSGVDSLNAHPYINFAEARAIVQYRTQHGAFNDINELLKIHILNAEWLNHVVPYLDVN